MPKSKKRIEALSELFTSEEAYIKDLTLWERDFRREIVRFPFLSLKAKYEICDLVFVNIHDIRILHEDIFKDMKEINLEIKKGMEPHFNENSTSSSFILDKDKYEDENILSLDYSTIYFKHASRFKIYEEYVKRLSKADFELEKIYHYSNEFRAGLRNFMSKNNIEFLGTKHFIYRPSQKLARYPLLLKAVEKNTENFTLSKYCSDLIEEFKFIAKKVDKIFNIYSTQFKIYRLDQTLKYRSNVKNQLCLGLFQKKRKLLRQGELLVRTSVFYDPFILTVYVFDHLILFCDIQQGEFQDHYILDDPIFLSKVILFKENLGFYSEDKNLNSTFSPLYILDTSTNKCKCLYFEDEELRNVYFQIIKKAMKKIRQNFNNEIKIKKMNINLENEINNACKTYKEEEYHYEGGDGSDIEIEGSVREGSSEGSTDDSEDDSEGSEVEGKGSIESDNKKDNDKEEGSITNEGSDKDEGSDKEDEGNDENDHPPINEQTQINDQSPINDNNPQTNPPIDLPKKIHLQEFTSTSLENPSSFNLEDSLNEGIDENVGTLYTDQELKRAISEYSKEKISENKNIPQWRSNLNTFGFVRESFNETESEEEPVLTPNEKEEGWFKKLWSSNEFFNKICKYEINEGRVEGGNVIEGGNESGRIEGGNEEGGREGGGRDGGGREEGGRSVVGNTNANNSNENITNNSNITNNNPYINNNNSFIKKQERMILTSSSEGIMKILDKEKILIYSNPVSKVLYDSTYQVIIFQSGSTLYVAKFNCEMDSLEKHPLRNDIGDFFYGTTKRGSYIASRNYGGGKSSLIYLFLIEKREILNESGNDHPHVNDQNNITDQSLINISNTHFEITIELSRKLYVGFKVYNIFFSREKIVIACKDFEVVDMDTLRTEELLENYDPFINIFFRSIPLSKARYVFPITKNMYLLCFDSLGFIVDILGRIITTERIFLWNCLPSDFKVVKNYLISVGKRSVDVYDIKTGKLIFTYLINGLKFVKGTREPILHDNSDFYYIEM